MKQTKPARAHLELSTQTVRALSNDALVGAAGGSADPRLSLAWNGGVGDFRNKDGQ